MQNFAKRFRQLRKEKRLTQEQLIADFNQKYNYQYASSTASKYETSKRTPELGALQDFAKYFEVSVSYLLGESEIRNAAGALGEENFIFIAGKNGIRRKYPVPADKVERFRQLLEAGFPELLQDFDDK
ncbi:MAG: helix-turn-helix domain-containing protein [Oscillospiraceae bacterium]|nr:helix-turn-helix domain-containing protein [Oscillospiraceae bacterium]